MARRRSRYLGVLRGNNEAARNKLISYFRGDIQVEYPSRQGNRPATREVYVTPFGIPLETGKKLVQDVNNDRWAGVAAFVSGFTAATHTEADQLVVPQLLVPRASITTGRSGTGTAETSKLTGLRYKSYGGQSVSVPFGEGAATDEKSPEAVFTKIFDAVKASNTANLCSFVPASYGLT